MEDEGSYGNDDIRCFILSNLAMHKMSRTFCVVCTEAMRIYDRYPLVDGTFFLSPKQYSKACIPVSSLFSFFSLTRVTKEEENFIFLDNFISLVPSEGKEARSSSLVCVCVCV